MKLTLKQDIAGLPAGTPIDVPDATANELITKNQAVEFIEQKATEPAPKAPETKQFGVVETIQKYAKCYADRGNMAETKALLGQGEASNVGSELVFKPIASEEAIQGLMAKAVLAPKCAKWKIQGMGVNGIVLPQVNETVRTSAAGIMGGVKVFVTAEAASLTPSTFATTNKSLSIAKYTGLTYVTRELLRDTGYMQSFVVAALYQALGYYLDIDIQRGTLGGTSGAIVGNAATVAITCAGNNPTAIELASMYSAMLPESQNKAEWFVGNAQKAALINLNTGFAGTSSAGYANDRPLFMQSFVDGVPDRLMGRPLNLTLTSEAVTKASSFGFYDLSQYVIAEKGEVAIEVSDAPAWLTDQLAIRMIYRAGSAPRIASKITLEDGSIVGPFVSRNSAS